MPLYFILFLLFFYFTVLHLLFYLLPSLNLFYFRFVALYPLIIYIFFNSVFCFPFLL
jgi:hypothetical protein